MARDHAVVLGAGIAGTLAARVLAEHFARVTVLDRDDITTLAGGPRKGVPQGRQPHLLLARGAKVLEDLHPGLLADLESDGVPVLRHFCDSHLEFSGHLLTRVGSPGEPMYQATRPFLENALRLRRPSNVALRGGCTVTDARVVGGRVCTLSLETPDGSEEIETDLTIDATGRGSRTPGRLSESGYPIPTETRIGVDVCYVTACLRLPDAPSDLQQAMLVSAHPRRPWGIAGGRVEGDRWLVTAYGYRGHHPTPQRGGILTAFAALAPPGWHDTLSRADWPERLAVHRYPYSVRRHYEHLRSFPEGLVVIGDGLCSFNPLYGQGMTLAALQALALRDCLAAGERDLPRRFYRAAAKPIDLAWRLSVAGDLGYPTVPGHRPPWIRYANAATHAILAAAEADPTVRDAFLRVSWLLDPPTRLARPGFLGRVARAAIARRRTTVNDATSHHPVPEVHR